MPIVDPTASGLPESVGEFNIRETGDNEPTVCMATLVSPRWALTAAHCFNGISPDQVANGGVFGLPFLPEDVYFHPDAWTVDPEESWTVEHASDSARSGFDLALIRLSSPKLGVPPARIYHPDDLPSFSGLTLEFGGRTAGEPTTGTQPLIGFQDFGPLDGLVLLASTEVASGSELGDSGSGGFVLLPSGFPSSAPVDHVCAPSAGEPGERALVGVLSAGDGTTDVYSPVVVPEVSGWILTTIASTDDDQDSYPNCVDPCPTTAPEPGNPNDLWGDQDYDGHCNGLDDNCPSVHNPTQSNCNLVTETTDFDFGFDEEPVVLGDACDPVPCARAETVVETLFDCKQAICPPHVVPSRDTCAKDPATIGDPVFCGDPAASAKAWSACSVVRRGEQVLTPLASHDVGPNGPDAESVDVLDVPTHARFCQMDEAMGKTCDTIDDIDDYHLTMGGTVTQASDELLEHPWHRISFTSGGPLDPDDVISLDYVFPHGTPGGEPFLHRWVWDYRADLARWQASGLVETPCPSFSSSCAPLRGALWFHSATNVGVDEDIGTGLHGGIVDDLANHHALGPYEKGITPEELECYACYHLDIPDVLESEPSTPGPAPQPFHIVWRKPPFDLSQSALDGFVRVGATSSEPDLLVQAEPGSTLYAVVASPQDLGGGCDGQLVNDRLGAILRERLSDAGLVWTSAVEPATTMGLGPQFPLAVALSSDGSTLVDAVTTNGAGLLAAGDRGAFIPPGRGSPDAVAYVPVLTRVLGGVFVVGGLEPSSRLPTGEIWFKELDGYDWRPIDTVSYQPEYVLAATYYYGDNGLYVLDETSGGLIRLTRVDMQSGAASIIVEQPRNHEWSRHWLVPDLQGGLLLASSRGTGPRRHAIARLEVNAWGPTGTWSSTSGQRALRLAPVVDPSGYVLVFQQNQGNGRVSRERRASLGMAEATLQDVVEQL